MFKNIKKSYRYSFGSFSPHRSFWLPDNVVTYATTAQCKRRLSFYDNLTVNAFPSAATGLGDEDTEPETITSSSDSWWKYLHHSEDRTSYNCFDFILFKFGCRNSSISSRVST